MNLARTRIPNMKANELQIGDLVHLKDVDMNLKVASISSTEFQRWNTNDEYNIVTLNSSNPDFGNYIESKEEETEPIPLTVEILEKNNCENYRGGFFNLQDPSLALSLESDGFVIGQDYGERGGFDAFIEIRYVRERQHMLRLCGLNELADNFKI